MESKELSDLTRGRTVSGVLQEFMEPLTDEWWRTGGLNRSLADFNNFLQPAYTIWNAVVYHDCYPKNDKLKLLANLRKTLPNKASGERILLEFFIKRKRQEFSEYRYLYRDFEFRMTKSGDISCYAEICVPGAR